MYSNFPKLIRTGTAFQNDADEQGSDYSVKLFESKVYAFVYEMWNAIRRFKTLVAQGVANNGNEDDEDADLDSSRHKAKRSASKRRSKKSPNFKLNLAEGDMEHLEVEEEKEEIMKEALWNVEIGEEANEDEDAQTKALRLFRFRILYFACNMDATAESSLDRTDPNYRPSPDYDTVQACRLVSKDWYDEISAIFLAVGKPLLHVNPGSQLQKKKKGATMEPEVVLETLKAPLVRPESLLEPNSDLSFPPFKLSLPASFFYKEIENAFIHTAWPHFEKYMYELHFNLPADSTMRYYWPKMNLENLRKIKFKCTNDTQNPSRLHGLSSLHYNPFMHGNYMYLIQQILNGAKNTESFTLHCYASHFAPALYRIIFPPGIKFMDIPLVKMNPEEVADCLQYGSSPKGHLHRKRSCPRKSLKHLILRAPLRTYRREDDISGCFGSFMLQKYWNSLEHFEMDVSGQEMDHIVWTMRRDYTYEPLLIEISKPMIRLKSITLHAGCWEISEMQSYKETLPVLKSLKLTLITRPSQIQHLHKSRSDTVEKLTLSFIQDIPAEVIHGFCDSFPNLKELDIMIKEKNPGLPVIFQSFSKLTKLHLTYNGCNSEEGKEILNYAVTGIPGEDWKAIRNEELTMLDAIKKYENTSSLRNLKDLQELKIILRSNSNLDISVMMRTTFLRMSSLKRLILSDKTIYIEDEQKDFIRKENQSGLIMEWV